MILRNGISNFVKLRNGQATLSFIIMISGLILEVAVAGALVSYFLSSSGLGERLSARALSASSSGIRDGIMRLVRSGSLCPDLAPYSMSINQDTTNISMDKTISGSGCEYTITSIGIAGTRQRKLVASLLINSTTGLAELRSITEQPVQ